MQLPAFSGRKKSINLLPKDSFESSGVGILLSWALTFGKWTVIITQLFVMGAFLYRFALDRQATNLRRDIAQQVAIVDSYSDIEGEFVLLQSRLKFAKPALAAQQRMREKINLLQSVTPNDVTYDRLVVSSDSIQFSATSSSLDGFSRLLSALQSRKEFASVNVAKIENAGSVEGALRFDVTLQSGNKETTKTGAPIK